MKILFCGKDFPAAQLHGVAQIANLLCRGLASGDAAGVGVSGVSEIILRRRQEHFGF